MTARQLADRLIARADLMPRESDCARHLREAAASLLDADLASEREWPTDPHHTAGLQL